MPVRAGFRRFLFATFILFVCALTNAGDSEQVSASFSNSDPKSTVPPSAADSGRPGYLLTLEVQNGRVRLDSAADIVNYMEGKHLAADDDWFLLLFNQAGECIGTKRFTNPIHYSPILSADQVVPLTVKIPLLVGLAAAAVFDQHREELLRIPIDGAFKALASANRQAFLAHDRENRRLLLEEARARRKMAFQPGLILDAPLRFEDMPADLQRVIGEETAVEMERLIRFGPEIMNARVDLPTDPEAMEWQLAAGDRTPAALAMTAAMYPAAKAYTLSGQVTDLDTGAPIAGVALDFAQYDASYKYQGYLGRLITDASGNYSMAVDAGYVAIQPDYSTVAGKRYVRRTELVKIDGNTSWNLRAIPGVLIAGSATSAQNQRIPGVSVTFYCKELGFSVSTVTSSSGSYSIVVPSNRLLRISLVAPSPYVAPPVELNIAFSADSTKDFLLEVGWLVSGIIKGNEGVALPRASVLLRQLTGTTTGAAFWSATTDDNGKYGFAVSKKLEPSTFVIAAYAQGYLLQSAGIVVRRDLTRDFQLVQGHTISGTVRDNAGQALRGVRVRAYAGGTFFTSALTRSDGSYALDLSPGLYELEALPISSTLAPVTLKNQTVDGPRTVDFTLSPAADVLTVNLYFPNDETYSRFAGRPLARFELTESGLTAYASSGVQGAGAFDQSVGKYYRPYRLYVKKGRYSLAAFLAGCQPIRIADIDVSGSTSVAINMPAPFLWTGVLRGADHEPLANTSILSYTDLARESEQTTTNASGQFSILLTPNGFVKFFTNPASSNILHTERIGNITAGRTTDCILDSFPSYADSGTPLTQMYGISDRTSRWNIVMIGDGYTGANESFTDTNGNGRWDGVLYYDVNLNGAWDAGEPYQRYGDAAAPAAGKDPTTNNEPFTDVNRDGFPNLHDQALFDQNTLDTARSLFGQDEWRRNRNAFNIFRIRVISKQAGHKILDKDGKVVIDRDTALGTVLGSPDRGYIFGGNNTLVSQYINQYVPECDTRIVLVNQPIRMGRVTSYIYQYGGEVTFLSSDYTIAHEMGHNVGLLSDEYTEYQDNYRGAEPSARNVTTLSAPGQIPWRHLIAPGKEIPSIPGSSGIGLYEGAYYYTGGVYRPTEYCMMVSGNRYCPVCTEEIEIRLRDIMGSVPDATPRSPSATVNGLYPEFSWDAVSGASHFIFELEKADGSQLVASYHVYNSSLTLPFALAAGTEYRWRIRPATSTRLGNWSSWTSFRPQSQAPAFTAVFAQIAAGGSYQTLLTGINTSQATANVLVSLVKSNGTPFDPAAIGGAHPVNLTIKPMGTMRLEAILTGAVTQGYARLASNVPVNGTALFKTVSGGLILSEAGVGLSKPGKSFIIYVDNLNHAVSGYAIANYGDSATGLTLTLRDASGRSRETRNLTLPAGQHFAEFAYQRFTAASAGFEGSIEFSSDQNVAAVALRFDNANSDVFSTIPVAVDESGTTLYFPQVADGSGYRTNFIIVNPSSSPTSAKLEFFSSAGAPIALPIAGVPKTSHDLTLNAKGVARFITDGTSSGLITGWVRASSPVAITGSSIFQTLSAGAIVSEAGVASSPLMQHFTTYVESLGSTDSGLAICNPNSTAVTLALNLRQSTGEIVAATNIILPAGGHLARFFSEWFPRGFGEFEGTLEVVASAPVSAVALRYDNPQQNVFATIPVVPVP